MSPTDPCCGGEPTCSALIRIPLLGETDGGGSCCPPPPSQPEFPYRDWPCQSGTLATPVGLIPQVVPELTWRDHLGHWAMRWGIGRDRYRIRPGLYAFGTPDATAPILVSANYKLSFDVLRNALSGRHAWLLVLDTRGINVWCAAGKGTFGSAELLRRVAATRLSEVVNHRGLIVPQLGAVGVAAHEVQKGCGFRVVYGPVRAHDLPEFLDAGQQATPAMRRVTFTIGERLILTPVELTGLRRLFLWSIPLLLVLGGIGPEIFSPAAALGRGGAAIGAGLAAVLAGAVCTPVLLPWLPGRAFAGKGWVAGLAVAAAALCVWGNRLNGAEVLALLAGLPAVASYCAMNFTGSSTFTSPSGVEKEMRLFIPLQATAALTAGISWIIGAFLT